MVATHGLVHFRGKRDKSSHTGREEDLTRRRKERKGNITTVINTKEPRGSAQ